MCFSNALLLLLLLLLLQRISLPLPVCLPAETPRPCPHPISGGSLFHGVRHASATTRFRFRFGQRPRLPPHFFSWASPLLCPSASLPLPACVAAWLSFAHLLLATGTHIYFGLCAHYLPRPPPCACFLPIETEVNTLLIYQQQQEQQPQQQRPPSLSTPPHQKKHAGCIPSTRLYLPNHVWGCSAWWRFGH